MSRLTHHIGNAATRSDAKEANNVVFSYRKEGGGLLGEGTVPSAT